MKKRLFNYIELSILILAFICCFIPCLRYDNNMVVDIYIFDANKIMGYSYMLILIFGLAYKIYLMKKNIKNKILNYWSLIIITIATILYIVSCLLRRNMWINFSLGFYLSISSFVLMLLLFVIKMLTKDNKKGN